MRKTRRKPYQDVWRNGQLVKAGKRDCEGRFQAIMREVVEPAAGSRKLTSGHTVLDVGAWDGYFSRRLHEAGASCTMLDQRSPPDLEGYPRIQYLQQELDGSTVWELPEYWLVLALAVLHHIPEWEQVFHGLRARSDWLVVETAVPEEAAEGRRLTPTLVATRPQITPVYEELQRVGREIHTTPGPNGLPRPLLLVQNSLVGRVEDGSGRAAPYMADPGLDEGHWEGLGYEPHPGTLNLYVGKGGRAWASRLPGGVGRSTEKLPGPYWPVRITSGGKSVDGHVRLSRAKVSVELVAPVRLRSELGLQNGDDVLLRVR